MQNLFNQSLCCSIWHGLTPKCAHGNLTSFGLGKVTPFFLNKISAFSSLNENLKFQKRLKARRNSSVFSSISHGTNASVRSVEEIQGIRNIHRRSGGSEWGNVNLSLDLDANEVENENVTDQEHHGHGPTPFYLSPIQESSVHPR